MKPINQVKEAWNQATLKQRERLKLPALPPLPVQRYTESSPPLKVVAGGLIKRKAVNKQAAKMFYRACYIDRPCTTLPEKTEKPHEAEILRKEITLLNEGLGKANAKLKIAQAEIRERDDLIAILSKLLGLKA